MTSKYPPISPKCPHMLHGGDYNPDQWMASPEVWREDMRLMKLAGCNAMSIGIFSWVALEPEEGRFEFGWMDRIMDMLADNQAYAVLATPSGARPAWLSAKYPEVLRVRPEGLRNYHGRRHNHCLTSPIYRQKVGIINRQLAQRYKDHPALLVWHISNEYSGECHCDLCQNAFRDWLRGKYHNNLDELNHAWWTAFWSHTYTDWSQVEPPSGFGENCVHGQTLDWKRFVTDQTVSFMLNEIQPLRELTPDVPVTTNLMGFFPGLNYWKLAEHLDVVSWDSYPQWHGPEGNERTAAHTAMAHDLNRSLKHGRPFMLMESVPGATNWVPVCKLKRPGMHLLSSLQAVAHGSDTVQYFQWRKSRGSAEKFHGAVVDHVGHEQTRVFEEVAQVGAALARLDEVVGMAKPAEVALICDWETRWAIEDHMGLGHHIKKYMETCQAHYRPFWRRGVSVDVIDQSCDLSGYKLVVAPMLYMLRPGMASRLEKFVAAGGTLVMTYWSGIVDENDLCHLGGWPGEGLGTVLGVWDEEIDAIHPQERNVLTMVAGNEIGLSGGYEVMELCALIHARGARVLATYGQDFYAGRPALTVNEHGKGRAYYIACRTEDRFLEDLYGRVVADLGVRPAVEADQPRGINIQARTDGASDILFVMNFADKPQTAQLGQGSFVDLLTARAVPAALEFPAYGVAVLRRQRGV